MTDNEMNPEVKAQWTAALRSGDYEQARGTLHDAEGGYCCLGVLCDLAVKAGVIETDGKRYGLNVSDDDATSWSGYGLPYAVRRWAGIPAGGEFQNGVEIDDYDSLIGLNDHAEYTFNQIADVIEEQF